MAGLYGLGTCMVQVRRTNGTYICDRCDSDIILFGFSSRRIGPHWNYYYFINTRGVL